MSRDDEARGGDDEGGRAAFAASANSLAGLAGAILHWRPHEFWSATPAELATIFAALTGPGDPPPPDTATLARLKEQFPDG